MTRTCPICQSPHDTWGGVAVHLWKKGDSEHGHVKSKDGGLEWLAREGHIGGDTSTPDDGGDDPAATTPYAGDSAGATTLEVPSSSDGGTSTPDATSGGSRPTCDGCGATPDDSAVYPSDEYLDAAGDQLPGATRNAIAAHDYVCTNDWKGIDA